MNITEIRIKPVPMKATGSPVRLMGFASITFDDAFVVRDLKIILGTKGRFVAMPSRKLMDRCHKCGLKNHLRAAFCNACGCKLDENRALRDTNGRAKLHADIAHPINSAAREVIQSAVLHAFNLELLKMAQPGYVSTYDVHDGTPDEADALEDIVPLVEQPAVLKSRLAAV